MLQKLPAAPLFVCFEALPHFVRESLPDQVRDRLSA
jgi:hypothetical protein